jgi:hypothetical protein
VPFDPEVFKLVALDLLDEAGVRFLFHALATGTLGSRRVEGVVFDTKSGPLVIAARVDCTGDGDIAALAGAPFEVGREGDQLVQPMSLMFRMVEFERAGFTAYCRAHPGQWRGCRSDLAFGCKFYRENLPGRVTLTEPAVVSRRGSCCRSNLLGSPAAARSVAQGLLLEDGGVNSAVPGRQQPGRAERTDHINQQGRD